jgi:hypothetical protein
LLEDPERHFGGYSKGDFGVPTNRAFLLTVSALLITTGFVQYGNASPQDKIFCRSYDRGSKNQHR